MKSYFDEILKVDQDIKKCKSNDIINYYNYEKLNEINFNYNNRRLNISDSHESDNKLYQNLTKYTQLTLNDYFTEVEEQILTINDTSNIAFKIKVDGEDLLFNIRYIFQHLDIVYLQQMFKNAFDSIRSSTSFNYEKIISESIDLFKIERNKKIIKSSKVFYTVLMSISTLLTSMKKNKNKKTFILKHLELLKLYFTSMDFIFDHLILKINRIRELITSNESYQKVSKFHLMIEKLKRLMEFITTIVKFNNIKDLDIQTSTINNFNSSILAQVIDMIFVLLKQNNIESYQAINILVDFILNFISVIYLHNFYLISYI